ncbi:HNH endonuclease signature motif containing protein [Mesorhizobium sp.]|uniref:HNH endonuclease signature motif containing protein n=1 Tax=Mesorhizobium sp. TaxID=1871066 RepID=UPI0025B9B45E|nr:HNH endonuclease signature motif containing protein [Mesorhizobium sp.]
MTAKRAREILVYDPETGRLTWRMARPGAPVGALVGTRTSEGYTQVEIDGRFYKAHRVIWLLQKGKWPKHHVDHRNGMRADNRWANLREATPAQNSHNRRPCGRNKSGVVGVTTQGKRWVAYIGIDNKMLRLGSFKTFEAAVAARSAAEKVHYGEFAAGAANAA